MRRIAIILLALAAGAAALATTSASGDDTRTYYIELDNAFGLVSGSEVKVAGVSAGSVTDFFINSDKRAVAKVELSGPVAVLGTGTICSTEPQSLIAEYFVDCAPKGSPIDVTDEDEAQRIENPDIPVEQTRQTVQNDLVMSALRLPFRERLRLIINEFGTALAGNGDNLNAAIRRGAPALEQTQKVFNLLAGQNTIIRDLNVNSDRIIGKLADRRQEVVRFIDEAGATAQASSERRDDLSQNFALLDDFLAELRPTMVELNGLAKQGTPLAANLRAAAPGLATLSRNLPDFNPAATDSVVSLGKAAVVGQRALNKGRDEINQLRKAAKNSFSPANNLTKFLRDIDDPSRAVETDARAARDTGRKAPTGYTGMESLLNYAYYQPGAINQFDSVGHFLHFSIFEIGSGPCASYNAGEYDPDGPGPEPAQPGVPNADGSGATTNILEANRCVAWLGANQPGINSGPSLPPYDPSVCPGGSADESLCNPAGTASSPAAKRSGGTGAGADGAGGNGAEPGLGGGGPSGGGSGTATPSAPTPSSPSPSPAPGDGSTPPAGPGLGPLGDALGLDPAATGSAPRSSADGGSSSGGNGNSDLLGYLFGS